MKMLQFQNHQHDLETLRRIEKNETRVSTLETRLEKKIDSNSSNMDLVQTKVDKNIIILNSFEEKFKNSRGTMDGLEKKILATDTYLA